MIIRARLLTSAKLSTLNFQPLVVDVEGCVLPEGLYTECYQCGVYLCDDDDSQNMIQLPFQMPDLSSYRESVDQAAAAENLRALAATTRDAGVLLGLCVFARAGDPVRKELAGLAVSAQAGYAPIAAVLTVIMDRIDAESVGELVQRDPDNALGHHLQGALLHIADRSEDALAAFRKGAKCDELRLYDSVTGQSLLKALDALNLQGTDRLCALSWTVARWMNFSSAGLQPTYWALSELARAVDRAARPEIADILLTLAGQLFATNFHNRWFAQRAVEAALLCRAELAAPDNIAQANGYAAAVQAMTQHLMSWPGLEDWVKPNPLQLAQFLPARIARAFAAADPSMMNARVLGETNLNPPETDRSLFEEAKQKAVRAAQQLIEVARTDPDGILGAYLKDLPNGERSGQNPPWASFFTPVGALIQNRPDLLRAAAANEEAMTAVWQAGANDPSQRNIRQMMDIACALLNHARNHADVFPETLDLLFASGLLKPPLEAKSLLTGRPYVYTAAGEKCPAKMNDRARFVLLYDDQPNAHGCHECAFGLATGGAIRAQDLQEQLRRRGR